MIINKPTQFFIDKRVFWTFFVLLFYLPFVDHAQALVYLCFFASCVSLGFILDNTENSVIKKIAFATLIILSALFAGLRDFGIGTDTNVYIMKYFYEAELISSVKDFIISDFNGDKGFLLLACVSRFFSSDPQYFLVSIALFIYFFTFFAAAKIYHNENEFSWILFLFIWFFALFHESLNLMRQYGAMSILLLSFVFLWEGKWLKALFLVIPAYFFHSSSIVFLIIFFFYILSFIPKQKRIILTIVFLLVSSILIIKIFDILPFLGNAGLISEVYAEYYGVDSKFESMNLFGPSFWVMYSIICYVIWILFKEGYFSNHTLMLAIGVHSYYFVFRLAALSVVYLSRLSTYFFYCDVLLLSMFLTKKNVPNEIKLLLYVCIIYMWYKGFIFTPGAETYPYKSSMIGVAGL